ncbi:dynein heavy chain, partial [Kipferlia bialata]
VVVESQLEDINNILNTGEVPNMYEADEIDKICNDLRPVAKEHGLASRDAIWRFFINRVRDNMHIVICMSPVGEAFRRRLRMFPSLVTTLVIDWFNPWP